MHKVEDTDRRLGAIFCQAFDDSSGLEHAFKVSDGYRDDCVLYLRKESHVPNCVLGN